jgi:Cys-tRNA synthase (O-phospho-L-seryl-tRNA:Cys-tRNA synthase)
MSKQDFGFSIGQRVALVECGLRGIVQSVLFNADGVQYQVSYWDERVRRVEWVFASEIESLQKENMVQPFGK